MSKELAIERSWIESIPWNLLGRLAGAAAFAVAMIAGAHIRFFLPGNPVPVTLQTLVVLLAGGLLGSAAGAAAVTAYLLMGLTGLPIFAGDAVAGLAYFTGPTAGYLAGFLLAVLVIGQGIARSRKLGAVAITMLLGQAIIFGCGVIHLGLVMKLGLPKAVAVGVVPFLPGAAIKTALATLVVWRFKR